MMKRITTSFAVSLIAFTELCLHLSTGVFGLIALIFTLVCGWDAIALGDGLLLGLAAVGFIISAVLFSISAYLVDGPLAKFAKRMLQPQSLFVQLGL
jgi:hypothetical protein